MKHLEELLDIAQKSNDCVLLEAVHGVGKSERLEAFGYNQNAEVVVLHLATQEVGDLIGIPTIIKVPNGMKEIVLTNADGIAVLDDNDKIQMVEVEDFKEITIWSKPSWLHRLDEANRQGRECVILLDEMNRAATDVLAASLSLVLDKKLHEHKLPKGKYDTFVCAAINPTGDYHTNEMDPALLDRFIGPIEIKADAEEWCEWARGSGVSPVVIKFIAKNPKYIHFTPKDGTKGTSPRSWTKVSKILENLDKEHPALFSILRGRLGKAIAAEFLNFYRNHNDMISVKDVSDIVKKQYDKGLSAQENLDKTRPLINKLLGDQEMPVVNNLVEEVYDMCLKKSNFLLLNHLCYGADIEVTTAFVKNLKAKDLSSFNKWATDSGSKGVFARIVKKVNIV